MKWRLVLALLAAIPVAGFSPAQAQQIGDIGELIYRTEKKLKFDCPMAMGKDHKLRCADQLLSISRVAGEFSMASTATLSCSVSSCFLTYPVGSSATAYADWVMPSIAMTVKSLVISWDSSASSGTVKWFIDWCAYGVGNPPCTPTGAHLVSYQSPMGASGVRVDLSVPLGAWANSWGTDQHVVWSLRRDGYAPANGDTLNGDVLLESMRLEMSPE